jgi:glucosylglycerate phosphorylase
MSQPKPYVDATMRERLRIKLTRLYSAERAPAVLEQLLEIITSIAPSPSGYQLSERDVILITYGDQVSRPGEQPLQTLRSVLKETVYSTINSVHILPFYPYSSDDGFSVIDYYAVDPELGDWSDVDTLRTDFRLMFDAVFNHISSQSSWFQAFLRGEDPYNEYFITVPPEADLSQVVRPRALPLQTPFETAQGIKYLWTTFSDDQIDLNFANPLVLLDMIRVLLFYVQHGADLIRLDAIAFLWKKIGTSCIHLEETHIVIQLLRDVLDIVAPSVQLITETNVPHEENISYFGSGRNEAQMVYQFPLAPLILHTFHTADASILTRWAQGLERVSDETTFFNFTASHDGIGLRPVTGILNDSEIAALTRLAVEHGGYVSYKTNSDGSQSPYELNITYFDAITHPDVTAAQPDVAVKSFIASQAIMLALIGVPAVYFHNLFGSRNYAEGVAQSARYRTINREKLNADQLLAELNEARSLRHQVYTPYIHLLNIRICEPAFHPLGAQNVLDLHPAVFAVERFSDDGASRILALTNISSEVVTVDLPGSHWTDLVSSSSVRSATVTLAPYQVMWLKPA